jgi:hypothetical protein
VQRALHRDREVDILLTGALKACISISFAHPTN